MLYKNKYGSELIDDEEEKGDPDFEEIRKQIYEYFTTK